MRKEGGRRCTCRFLYPLRRRQSRLEQRFAEIIGAANLDQQRLDLWKNNEVIVKKKSQSFTVLANLFRDCRKDLLHRRPWRCRR